ncbi:MAG: mandelate racemase/muconate lactonizing enzyme family protein [Dehalococcoidia bacterium]|nr:mandelate racemase/muconate lactonizing enzyme family protein [Dehalococcoidia bacterium]
MKITDVRTIIVQNDADWSRGGDEPAYRGGKYLLFLELVTDEGITGLGERITGNTFSGAGREFPIEDMKSQIALIHEIGRQYLIGENPFNVELIWQKVFGDRHDFRHPSLHATPALSAVEMACWDIIGKATNQPIYNLLGGMYHEKLKAYAYMPAPEGGYRNNPELAGETAIRLVEEGNSACKLDPFPPSFPLPRDIPLADINIACRIFESIRKAVGDKLEVGIGTHGQLTTYSAIRVAHAMEQYSPFWFEEPVPPENVDEMARVAAHTSIPIATGERLVSKYEFSEVLEKQAAQIIQLDVGQCGGIMEAKKIAGIAEAHYAMIAPHMYCGPIAASAAIQLDTCSPNFVVQEANQGPLHKIIFKEPIVFENGFIIPPTGPGLGIELDMDVLKNRIVG